MKEEIKELENKEKLEELAVSSPFANFGGEDLYKTIEAALQFSY